MTDFRAQWDEERAGAPRPVPGLHMVSRVAPRRPRWRALYVTLAAIATAGGGAHLVFHSPAVVTAADAVIGLALFTTLAGWIRLNRIALTRLDEPDAGPGRPRIRIVRSRARRPADETLNDRIVRLDPEDRVILPYDFR